jgi:hypothetical protein
MFFGQDHEPERRRHAEDVEEALGHTPGIERDRVAAAGEVDAERLGGGEVSGAEEDAYAGARSSRVDTRSSTPFVAASKSPATAVARTAKIP